MNENQDSFFRDKLYDLESPLNEKVTFEEVMERRKKKRRVIFWWNPKMYVVAGLFVVGGLGMYLSNPFEKSKTPVSTKVVTYKAKIKQSENHSNTSELTNDNQSQNNEQIDSKAFIEGSSKTITGTDIQLDQLGSKKKSFAQTIESENDPSIGFKKSGLQNRRGFSNGIENLEFILENQIFETSKEYLKLGRHKQLILRDFMVGRAQTQEDKNYTWQNKNELIRSLGLSAINFKLPEFDFASFDIELDIPDRPLLPKLPTSKWYAELSVITGSNNSINFEENVPLSILGTQYMAQYQMLILKDLENGSMLGAGIQYSEWVGNGQWQLNKNEMIQKIDTNVVRISAPWQPKRYLTIIDTSYVSVNNVQTGNIEYRIDKISFPLAYRFYTQIAKTPVRFGIHLAPGYTTVNSGTYFTNTDYRAFDKSRYMTIDGKLTLGPMIPINKKWTFVIEPSLMYQSFLSDNNSTVNGKFFTGLGIAILRKL